MEFSDKELEIISWRKESLMKAGWEPSMALEIAQTFHVDLHVAQAAIQCGDPDQALYLLSLVDEPNNR